MLNANHFLGTAIADSVNVVDADNEDKLRSVHGSLHKLDEIENDQDWKNAFSVLQHALATAQFDKIYEIITDCCVQLDTPESIRQKALELVDEVHDISYLVSTMYGQEGLEALARLRNEEKPFSLATHLSEMDYGLFTEKDLDDLNFRAENKGVVPCFITLHNVRTETLKDFYDFMLGDIDLNGHFPTQNEKEGFNRILNKVIFLSWEYWLGKKERFSVYKALETYLRKSLFSSDPRRLSFLHGAIIRYALDLKQNKQFWEHWELGGEGYWGMLHQMSAFVVFIQSDILKKKTTVK